MADEGKSTTSTTDPIQVEERGEFGTQAYKEALAQNAANRAASTREPEENPDPAYGVIVEIDAHRRMEWSNKIHRWCIYTKPEGADRWLLGHWFDGPREEAAKFAATFEIGKVMERS